MSLSLRTAFAVVAALLLFASIAGAQVQTAEFAASDTQPEDRFGWAVDADGNTLVVTATQDFKPGAPGAAYVFVRSGGNWVQQARLDLPGGEPDAGFGSAAAIDGDFIAVGATAADTEGGQNAGAVYIFRRSGDTWPLQARVIPDDAGPFDLFGISLDLEGDRLVVGAWGDNEFGNISGSAFVFQRSGDVWLQEAKLYASDPNTGDRFGVDISVHGERLIVGASGDTGFRGAAYIFDRIGGAWIEQVKLSIPTAATFTEFGRDVIIRGDTAIVGAPGENGATGAVYVYENAGGSWSQQQRLLSSDAAPNDRFGEALALQGNTLAVGALQFMTGNGAVYLFEQSSGSWTQQTKVIAADGANSDAFGFSVALDGFQLFVGAPLDDDFAAPDGGSTYVFELQTIDDQFDSIADQIEDLVDDGTLNGGQGNSLLAKLNAALNQARRGNTTAAINQLQAFIHEVEAMRDAGTLPDEDADALIAAAEAIVERLMSS